MKIDEVMNLNQILLDCSGKKNLDHKIYIDNLHTPYAEFSKNYILPGTSTHSIDFISAKNYISAIAKLIPEAVEGCSVLPEPRPKRESEKIFLVKKFVLHEKQFLYILKLEPTYLGGAESEQILQKATQEKTASILTNRIYFSTRIIQIEHTISQDQTITDFQAKNYTEGNFKIETGSKGILSEKKRVSELFDEIDFSDLVTSLKHTLSITDENWKLGKVFDPVGVEYLSISLKFLSLSQKQILNDFQNFSSIFDFLFYQKELPADAIDHYKKWLDVYSMERSQSPSGNVRWKIARTEI